jgi:hypothetical protein
VTCTECHTELLLDASGARTMSLSQVGKSIFPKLACFLFIVGLDCTNSLWRRRFPIRMWGHGRYTDSIHGQGGYARRVYLTPSIVTFSKSSLSILRLYPES